MADNRKFFSHLVSLTLLTTFCVIILGAYVRLTDAGLGCPDWPGCYGNLINLPQSSAEIEAAQARYPERPFDIGKAWREMAHRYLAGFLGLLILATVIAGWRVVSRGILLVLSAVVILQALLGMWTVTLLLQPLIVVSHLLGGFTVLSLLWWIYLDQKKVSRSIGPPPMKGLLYATYGAIFLLLVQITLGGWTSSNYAALACSDFPTCHGQWWPSADFAEGFALNMRTGTDYEYGVLDNPARTAIHFTHRLGALLVLLYFSALLIFVFMCCPAKSMRKIAAVTAIVLLGQITLGVSNVLYVLPLPVAVAHNGVAAILLLCTLSLARNLHSPVQGA